MNIGFVATLGLENPCVGGSIPPQATKLINPSSDGFFFDHPGGLPAGIAQLVERYLAKV